LTVSINLNKTVLSYDFNHTERLHSILVLNLNINKSKNEPSFINQQH